MAQPSNPIPQPTPVRRDQANDKPCTPSPTRPSQLPVPTPKK